MGLCFKQLDMLKVSQDVLDHFDCGHPDFNCMAILNKTPCYAGGQHLLQLTVKNLQCYNYFGSPTK